jgi:hypothetical protein
MDVEILQNRQGLLLGKFAEKGMEKQKITTIAREGSKQNKISTSAVTSDLLSYFLRLM